MRFNLSKIAAVILTFILIFAFITSAFAETKPIFDLPVNRHLKHIDSKSTGPIMSGAGFSHDSEQVPSNICYNTKINSTTGQQGVMQLNTATSFADLEKQLHISVDAKIGIGKFSAGADADYLRSIQDLDYSLSLNYYEYLFNQVMLQLNGVGQNALTQQGKDIYNNAKEYFGILCGDDYISSYHQGALLLMGINIRFHSHLDKEQFNASMGGSFGNIISASTQIQSYAKQYNVGGTVIIQAYQKGGNPSELSKILSKDEKGVYYALSCDLQHMDSCVKAANGLLAYAAENFPKQVSFKPGEETGLVPLGAGFIRHDPVSEYGVTPPPSLVTQQVIQDRKALADSLDENQYYQQKFNELLSGYPVPWNTESDIYKNSQKLYKYVNDNIDFIMLPTNPDDGALKCYSHPTLCHQITQSIQSRLHSISSNDLNYLNEIKIIASNFGFMYQTKPWFPVSKTHFIAPSAQFGYFDGTMEISDNAISNINMRIVPCPDRMEWVNIVGNFQGKNNDYQGRLCFTDGSFCGQFRTHLSQNPFLIEVYKPSKE